MKCIPKLTLVLLLYVCAVASSLGSTNEPNLTYKVYENNGIYYLKSDPSSWVPIGTNITLFIPFYEDGQILKLQEIDGSWQVSSSSISVFHSIAPSLQSSVTVEYADVDDNGFIDLYFSPSQNAQKITLLASNSWYNFAIGSQPLGNSVRRITYIHTDILGSPVAHTK